MEQQLLILGNGFDLACGLKSSYKDFYTSLVYEDFEKRTYDKEFLKHTTSSKIPEGKFWLYLLYYYEQKYNKIDYNWCNIEKIIEEIITDINLPKDNHNAYYDLAWDLILSTVKDDNIDWLQNYQVKEKNIISKFIVSFIYKYIWDNHINEIYRIYEKNRKSKITPTIEHRNKFNGHLLEQLNELEKDFCKYLKTAINNSAKNPNYNYQIKSLELFDKIKIANFTSTNISLNQHSLIRLGISDYTCSFYDYSHIISFNYTNILNTFSTNKKIFKDSVPIIIPNNPNSYVNVHGSLCDNDCINCTSLTAIFGVDNKIIWDKKDTEKQNTQTQNNETNEEKNLRKNLRIFSKTYRTLSFNRQNTISLPKLNDKDKLTIKFYGHSLASADYSYFQSIFDYYSIYDNNNIGLEFYYSIYEGGNKSTIESTQKDNVYNLINEYGLTLNNKDQGRNLIHKLQLENRINLIEI